jgi:hypothetical protein
MTCEHGDDLGGVEAHGETGHTTTTTIDPARVDAPPPFGRWQGGSDGKGKRALFSVDAAAAGAGYDVCGEAT